jgi:putative ABC transport system permease protein
VEALPGVISVGVTNGLPITGQGGNSAIVVEGVTAQLFERPLADVRGVNPDFFRTMGIPLRSGAIFTERDRAKRTAVVSVVLADRAWPNQNPLGKRLRIGSDQGPLFEVVGVVGDVRGVSLDGTLQFPTVYLPYWYRSFNQATVAVKTAGDPAAAYAGVREAIRSLDPELPIQVMRMMDDVVMASVAPRQFQMRLVLLFGFVALMLSSLGIYGVVSYSVVQRTSEMGLRMALGAAPQNIGKVVLRQAMLPVLLGLAAGLAVAAGMGRLLRAMLFGVTPMDPVTLGSVALILLTVGLVASYLPTRRAMTVDPMAALRYE